MGSLLSGLGEAALGRISAAAGKSSPSPGVRKVVHDFFKGKVSKTGCGGKKGLATSCSIESDGLKLVVKGETIAKRSAPNTDTIQVCVNPNSKVREHRQAAGAILRSAKAGIGVRDTGGDTLKVSGRKGRSKAAWPGCVQVRVTKAVREEAARNINKAHESVLKLEEKKSAKKKAKKSAKKKAGAKKAKKSSKK